MHLTTEDTEKRMSWVERSSTKNQKQGFLCGLVTLWQKNT